MRNAAALTAGLLSLLHCWTVPAAAASEPSETRLLRCGTLERLPGALQAPRPAYLPLGGGKLTRESFPGQYQVRESDNFAVRWNSPDVSFADAGVALAALEHAWALYIAQLGHTVPAGADRYRVNAYISGPGDEPAIEHDGGFAAVDEEGFAYVVGSASLFGIDGGADEVRHVFAHEFYHGVQYGLDGFRDPSGYWYWEAAAEWAAQEAYPDLAGPYSYVGAYAVATELPIYLVGDPFGSTLDGLHQYGASIFPRRLTERYEGPGMVVESWETAGPDDDPLLVLDQLLPEGDIASAFAEFAPRMAVLDFSRRDLILPSVNSYSIGRARIVARVPPDGTGGWVAVPEDRQLRAFGANVIAVERPDEGEFHLAVDVEPLGTEGTPVDMAVTIVRETDDGITYAPISLKRRSGATGVAAQLVLDDPEAFAFIVVSATAETRSLEEIFPYRFRVDPGPGPDLPGEPEPGDGEGEGDDASSGCTAAGSRGGWFAVLLIAIAAARSRRRDQ